MLILCGLAGDHDNLAEMISVSPVETLSSGGRVSVRGWRTKGASQAVSGQFVAIASSEPAVPNLARSSHNRTSGVVTSLPDCGPDGRHPVSTVHISFGGKQYMLLPIRSRRHAEVLEQAFYPGCGAAMSLDFAQPAAHPGVLGQRQLQLVSLAQARSIGRRGHETRAGKE